MKTHEQKEHHQDLDQQLCRALDPDPATVDRLVKRALAERQRPEPVRPFLGMGWGWAASAALLLLLVFGLAVGIPFDEVPPTPVDGPIADSSPSDPILIETPAPGGAALRISNVGDVVTVSSLGGSHFIAVPGDNS